MGRLIDVEAVNGTFAPGETYMGREVMALLNQQPIAYDVDKVIEQINKMKNAVATNVRINTQEYDIEREVEYATYPYDNCIDIVKGAVKNE